MNFRFSRIHQLAPAVLSFVLMTNEAALSQITPAAPKSTWHVWSDGKGVTVEAELLSVEGDFIQVRTRQGQPHRLNLTKLVAADRVLAQQMQLALGKSAPVVTGPATATAPASPATKPAVAPTPSAPQIPTASVSAAAIARTGSVSFRRDVMPVFFRANCNSGGCHGAASGKDGFHLSLFGYDPAGDYFRLTKEMPGRRLDLVEPEQSLLLLKATGGVPHTGGKLFDKKSANYKIVLKWIQEGGLNDSENVADVTGIRLDPPKLLFKGAKKQVKLRVLASYSDGKERDMTSLAQFITNNKTTANISEDGHVTSGRQGATDVFARFSRFTVGAEVVVLPSKDKFQWPREAKPVNYIDEQVFSKLNNLRIEPSNLATDEEFMRRVFLDVTGLPPTEDEIKTFLASQKPDKRAQLVDILLERPEYAELWAARWSDWLKVNGITNVPTIGCDPKAAKGYHTWILEQFKKNVPLDRFLKEQLVATGSNFDQPETNFYTMLPAGNYDAKLMAQNVAQIYLGIRINCAECHNHPFDLWTQDDYYSFVSFFTGVKRKMARDPREYYIYNNNTEPPAKHKLDERPMPTKFPGGELAKTEGKDPRIALADWITSPTNTVFSTNLANRIWSQFFGAGIVDPIDDIRVTNPPSNRGLLDELGKRLVSYGFDQKKLIRDIVNSRTYQLSCRVLPSNKEDERQFSHAPVRRIPAVTVLDAISAVTEVDTRWVRRPQGFRAMQIYDSGHKYGSYFLSCFGQSDRSTPDAGLDNRDVTLSQTLHMIVGETISDKIRDSKVVANLMAAKTPPEQIVESMYLRALCRKPTPKEFATFQKCSAGVPNGDNFAAVAPTREDYDRLWWALLNSTEFLFQH